MKDFICPKCSGAEIKHGKLGSSFGAVQMFPEQMRGPSSPISAEYCQDCGYILASYVDNPEDVH